MKKQFQKNEWTEVQSIRRRANDNIPVADSEHVRIEKIVNNGDEPASEYPAAAPDSEATGAFSRGRFLSQTGWQNGAFAAAAQMQQSTVW